MSRQWQCTVCGYVHTGDEPPETCPVCGADRTKFVPLEKERISALGTMLATFALHPVAAHFPGGLIPTAALFLMLFVVTGNMEFEATVFSLLVVATAVVPVSLASGLYDRNKYFAGSKATIFTKKITLALSLLLLGCVSIFIRHRWHEWFAIGSWHLWVYLGCVAGMLLCVVALGHYGAILVSRKARQ